MQSNDWSGLMARINGMSNQFTKTDWKIVNYIKASPGDFIEKNAQELAAEIGTSDASIIRFTQKVGYSGLNEFKYVLQQQFQKPEPAVAPPGDENELLQDNKTMLEVLYAATTPEKLTILRRRILAARRMFVVGLDNNQHVAAILAHKYSLLGINVVPVTNYDSLEVYRRISTPDDLFLTISLSGEREALAQVLGDLVQNGSYIVLLSNHEKSLCAALADLLLLIPKTDMLKNSEVISREISLLQLGDIIFHSLLSNNEEAGRIFKKTASYASREDDWL